MGSTQELRTGKIVRYTDPDGKHHDAVVNTVLAHKVRIKLQDGFSTSWLWVSPKRISVPR